MFRKLFTIVTISSLCQENAAAFQFASRNLHRPTSRLAPQRLWGNEDTATATVDFTELKHLGFTQGLCETMLDSKDHIAKRFWIVDDSGSMATPDGTRLATGSEGEVMVPCTRWKELQQTIQFHAKVASLLQASTSFQFLNQGTRVKVEKPSHYTSAYNALQRAQPNGATPLARKIMQVKREMEGMLPQLEQTGQRLALIIATDGLPTDDFGFGGDAANEELGKALTSLQGLPVWLVIRLCTDDDKVVSFYNGLDDRLELNMDVLDDWKSEAQEVQSKNRWINYGLALHRVREMGCASRVLDLLDERKLTKDEVRDYCGVLLGQGNLDGFPDPQADWHSFKAAVEFEFAQEEPVLNPVTFKQTPWVNLGAY